MFTRDNLRLLRLPFSLFLLPIYAFALLTVHYAGLPIRWGEALLIFAIVHLLVYPASNAYNSWMDQDTGPIGGLRNPPKAQRSLYHLTLLLDGLALVLSAWISWGMVLLVAIYIATSKAYSWRGIRIKKYPWLAWLTVGLVQGSYTYWLFWTGISGQGLPWQGLFALGAAFFLVGATYPLTQVFQHTEDAARGDRTLSLLLGVRGTFGFAGALYLLGFACLGTYFISVGQASRVIYLLLGTLPVVLYFLRWAVRTWQQPAAASWSGALWMNIWAAVCLSGTFGALLLWT